MSTTTRPELSAKSKWRIGKHRYYELKHFCLQYGEWKKQLNDIDGLPPVSPGCSERVDRGSVSDPTAVYAETRVFLSKHISLIDRAAFEACEHQFWYWMLMQAVTENLSYDILEARNGIMPVSRNEWYALYRKFFWYLDKLRE